MACGCPNGYTYNQDTGLCEKLVYSDPSFGLYPTLPPLNCTNKSFMSGGTLMYPSISKAQWPLLGNSATPPFFVDHLGTNIIPASVLLNGNFWISGGQSYLSRMNMGAVGMKYSDSPQGYAVCLTVEDGELYTFAICSVWGYNLYIDGNLVIQYFPATSTEAADYLQIVPIQLDLGNHNIYIESITKINCGGDSFGAFLFEIYKNVSIVDLASITTTTALYNIIATQKVNGIDNPITTEQLRYRPFDTGEFGTYGCDAGNLTMCQEGAATCVSTETEPPTPCYFKLINCADGTIHYTTTNLSGYMSLFVQFNEISGCYAINASETAPSPITVTIKSTFTTCELCRRVYYRLVDCAGTAHDLYTYTDLSANLNKTIRIAGSSVCWIVLNGTYNSAAVSVEVTNALNGCQDC